MNWADCERVRVHFTPSYGGFVTHSLCVRAQCYKSPLCNHLCYYYYYYYYPIPSHLFLSLSRSRSRRGCDLHRHLEMDCGVCGQKHHLYPSACCFLDELPDLCQPCDLVTDQTRDKQWLEWRQASPGDRVQLEQDWGIVSWEHGLTGVPGVSESNPASIVPFDWMHCGPEGMLKHEFAAFVFVAVKRLGWFTMEELKRAWVRYPWPPGQGAPPFPHTTFLDGRRIAGETGSFPKSNIHFHWTASQVPHRCISTRTLIHILTHTHALALTLTQPCVCAL